MRDKIKLRLTYYMLQDLHQYVSDAIAILSEHETKRDRNKLMVFCLLNELNYKLYMQLGKGLKSKYNLFLTITEACALHEYYNKLNPKDYVQTTVTMIVGEIDKQTA